MAVEYIYDGFEIDEEAPESFAARIREEVCQIGGEVVHSRREGHPKWGVAKVMVAFESRYNLEAWIRMYYTQGGLDPDEIEQEIASIREA